MVTFFRVLSICPLWLLHALGWGLGWVSFLGSATYRQRFIRNAQQAGFTLGQVLPAVGHAGKMLAELPRLWLGKPTFVRWNGIEHIQAAHAQGASVLFVTPHMGCFEITPQAYAAAFQSEDKSITVLYRKPRKVWLQALVQTARQRAGMHTAQANTSGVRQLLRAVKAGQAIGMLPDQVPPDGMGEWLPFFGKNAYTMTLAARLAQQPNATVLLAWGERLSWGRGYCVHVQPLRIALSADLTEAATQVNAAMEQLIRQCPQQYLWGYGRYKKGRKL